MGTSFDGRQQLIKNLSIGQALILVREPENEYDPNAIAIYNQSDEHLGYVAKETAAKINNDVKQGNVVCTVAEITGGTAGKENFGCNITLFVTREGTKENGEN